MQAKNYLDWPHYKQYQYKVENIKPKFTIILTSNEFWNTFY